MDITKLKNAIAAAQTEVQNTINVTVAGIVKNPGDAAGLQKLVQVGQSLAKSMDRLEEAKEKTTPKVKEEKADKKK